MKKIAFTIFCLLVLCETAKAQGEFIVEIDEQNGTYSKVGPPISNVTYVFPDETAFNQNDGSFFFLSSLVEKRLHSINTANGQVQNNPLIASATFGFEFDSATNSIYAIQNTTGGKKFVSVSLSSGAQTNLGDTFGSPGYYQGDLFAISTLNDKYTFLDPPGILYTLETSTGTVLLNPDLTLPAGTILLNMSYDNSTGNLFGILKNNSTSTKYLASIDTVSGIVTPIGQGTTSSEDANGSGTIDEVNQRYIACSYSNQNYNILVLDLSSGNIVSNVNINPIAPNDNFHGLEYDNTLGKLYALHWDAQILGTEDFETKEIALVPNPFSEYATLTIPDSRSEVFSIDIYDATGIRVKTIENIATNEFRIDREDLSTGFYFYQLSSNNVTFHTGKFIVK